MMTAFVRILFVSFISVILLVSCATADIYGKADEAVLRGDFEQGMIELESQKSAYNEQDAVLQYLDIGMMAHYVKDYKKSSDFLQNGERAIEAAFTKSISRNVASFVVNDSALEYAGEDYEDIYTNVFNSLNYYHRGDLDGALVEIRRIGNKLRALSTKYGTMFTNLEKALPKQEFEIPNAEVEFSDSALARYFSMLFYRGEGLWDDARIDQDFIKLAFENQSLLYPFDPPSSIDDELEIPSGKARLNIVGFNGFSPVKIEETIRIPLLLTENYLKIALPVMTSRPSNIAFTKIVMDSGEEFELELIEDIDLIAKETFKLNQKAIYLRTIIRSVAKTAASTTFNVASELTEDDEDTSGVSVLFDLLSIGSQVFIEVSEQADLRISHYFPGKVLVGGINLEPGKHSFSIHYYDRRNQLVYQQRFENVTVRENQLNLIEAICLQ
jgi:hypothetical protein